MADIDTTAAVAREAVSKLSQASLDPGEFLYEVSMRIRRVVPCDASGWMTLDPDTLLPTGTIETDKPSGLVRALWRNELLTPDVVHKLADFSRLPAPVVASSQLDPAMAADSPRIQLIHRPAGIGDDVRGMLGAGGTSWGHFALYREIGTRHFNAGERAFLADIAYEIALGLRRSLSRRPEPGGSYLVPGVVAFSNTGSVISETASASLMMALMPGDATSTLYAVALSASRQDGAHARVRLSDGRWLLLYGGQMHCAPGDPAQVTVTLTPAPRAHVSSMLLRLHGLSTREREVAELLMFGATTSAIAARLHISPHTLRDHVKSIFTKIGASSRAELMALGSELAFQ